MRLFIALYPTQEYLSYFAQAYRMFEKQKRNLRPLPLEQIHLTLKFVGGHVSENSKDQILELLETYAGQYAKPTIGIKKLMFGFQRQSDPRHLLADIVPDPGLMELNDQVHMLIRSLKLRDTIRWKDKYANDFHMTIARMKATATKSSGKEIKSLMPVVQKMEVPAAFQPEYMEMMESVSTDKGIAYRKIASIKI